jgi:hypothetical protein
MATVQNILFERRDTLRDAFLPQFKRDRDLALEQLDRATREIADCERAISEIELMLGRIGSAQ